MIADRFPSVKTNTFPVHRLEPKIWFPTITEPKTNLSLQVNVIFNEDSNSIFMTILTGSLKSSVAGKHTIDLMKGSKADII